MYCRCILCLVSSVIYHRKSRFVMLENLETRFTYQPLIGNRLRHGKFISDVQYMTSGFSQIYEDGSLVVRETHSSFFLFFCIAKKKTLFSGYHRNGNPDRCLDTQHAWCFVKIWDERGPHCWGPRNNRVASGKALEY